MFKNGIVITGPIGSGKSEALKIIKKLGYLLTPKKNHLQQWNCFWGGFFLPKKSNSEVVFVPKYVIL